MQPEIAEFCYDVDQACGRLIEMHPIFGDGSLRIWSAGLPVAPERLSSDLAPCCEQARRGF